MDPAPLAPTDPRMVDWLELRRHQEALHGALTRGAEAVARCGCWAVDARAARELESHLGRMQALAGRLRQSLEAIACLEAEVLGPEHGGSARHPEAC